MKILRERADNTHNQGVVEKEEKLIWRPVLRIRIQKKKLEEIREKKPNSAKKNRGKPWHTYQLSNKCRYKQEEEK